MASWSGSVLDNTDDSEDDNDSDDDNDDDDDDDNEDEDGALIEENADFFVLAVE